MRFALALGPRRAAGVNPRAVGTNPRAKATNPRQAGTAPRCFTPEGRARLEVMDRRRRQADIAVQTTNRALDASLRSERLEMAREAGRVCSACEGSSWRYVKAGDTVDGRTVTGAGAVRCDHRGFALLLEVWAEEGAEPP